MPRGLSLLELKAKMATANVVSDCKLVDESLERKYDCPVCLQILRDPCKSLCCGNDFCHACVRKLRKADNPCPLCRSSRFRIERNRDLSSEVYYLHVYCANKAKGCDWEGCLGEIDVHLNQNPAFRYQANGCHFVHVQCLYCSQNFQRDQICDHVSTCPRRPYQCEYCQEYNSFYGDVLRNHWPVCHFYPVLCPNGCSESIPRQNLREHIAQYCSMTVIECEFKQFGCTAKLTRRDMSRHMKYSVAAHKSLKMMTEVIGQLKDNSREIRELETKLYQKQKNLIKEQKELFDKKISSATNQLLNTGQQQVDSVTELNLTLRRRNKQLMNEQQRTINERMQCAINELEDKVRCQVERELDFKYANQIKELRAENMRILYEVRLLHHCQHFTAWLYLNLRYRYGETFLVLLLLLILLICWLIWLRWNSH